VESHDIRNIMSNDHALSKYKLPSDAAAVLSHAPKVTIASNVEELIELSTRDTGPDGYHVVGYEVEGKGFVEEVKVCRVRNGVSANYVEPYMRRRDPDCMVIGDKGQTDKPTFRERYGQEFDSLRAETLEWLKTQELACFAFNAGMPGRGTGAIVIAPANAGFFALGLAMLQGIVDPRIELPRAASPARDLYRPPFRHTHLEGKQVVVHNRTPGLHELFAYNLYPGPSAKKGVYGVLLNLGEQRGGSPPTAPPSASPPPTTTRSFHARGRLGRRARARCSSTSTARPTAPCWWERIPSPAKRDPSPYAAMLQISPGHRRHGPLPPSLNRRGNGKLTLMDAEDAWFVRVNHIEYGIDPHLERMTVARKPAALPQHRCQTRRDRSDLGAHRGRAGLPLPQPPRVIPLRDRPHIHRHGTLDIDVRSFGVRTPSLHPGTPHLRDYGAIPRPAPLPGLALATGRPARARQPSRSSTPGECPARESAPTGPSPPAAAWTRPT
jgi:hypothetical protein